VADTLVVQGGGGKTTPESQDTCDAKLTLDNLNNMIERVQSSWKVIAMKTNNMSGRRQGA